MRASESATGRVEAVFVLEYLFPIASAKGKR
jgi:hypothetical protein